MLCSVFFFIPSYGIFPVYEKKSVLHIFLIMIVLNFVMVIYVEEELLNMSEWFRVEVMMCENY